MKRLIQQRKYFYAFSMALMIASIAMLSVWGLKLGIDFRGGTLLEVSWSEGKVPDRGVIETHLKEVPRVESLVVQPSGDRTMFIRYASSDETVNEAVLAELKKTDESVELVRSEFIGASVSESIKKNAITALFLAVIGIILYIAWAFRGVSRPVSSWHYGFQATVALAHDIIITLGAFSLFGHFYGMEVGAPFIAALLTILGYSVNDTIVVYDRIRENLIRSGGTEDFEEVVNHSLNQTIARSFNTSFTVIIVLIAISVLGGESIRSFSLALLVGVTAGTYSSIYIATALLVSGNIFRKNRLLRKAETSLTNSGKKKEKKEKHEGKKESRHAASQAISLGNEAESGALGSAPVALNTVPAQIASVPKRHQKKRKKGMKRK
ncbi:MAG: protein translocase subunit SecF [Candidatus Moraniibacteriota bacterium]|nr:MAG: protein translocase subunit SecF [Candidatus Moranbacteria bacterium]